MVSWSDRHRLEGRLTLNRKPAPVIAQLASKEPCQSIPEQTEAQRFEAALYEARNLWDIERRTSSRFVPDRRMNKAEADAKLRLLMRQMIGGGR